MSDYEEFSTFAGPNVRPLLRSARMLTGDWASAEDLVQLTLEKAWRKWHIVGASDQPGAYVQQMMVNVFLSSRRRRWIFEQSTPDWSLGETIVHSDMEAVENREALRQALLLLPPKQRAVIVLRYLLDQTEQQTAAVLGCSVGAVKSHNSRALHALKRNQDLRTILEEAVTP